MFVLKLSGIQNILKILFWLLKLHISLQKQTSEIIRNVCRTEYVFLLSLKVEKKHFVIQYINLFLGNLSLCFFSQMSQITFLELGFTFSK